jgi:hypothetical protein
MALADPDRLAFIDREKNLQGLADLGMLRSEVPELLRHLTLDDFSEGPLSDDRGRPRNWWVFGPERDGVVVYVKVTVVSGRVECLSLHPAEHSMSYPFRQEEPDA